jgi:hypothetical protein
MKYIITESQDNKMVEKLTNSIKSDGWSRTSKLVGGDENLIKLLGITSPMEFLHLFDNLNVSKNKEEPDWTLFNNNMGDNLMIYNKKNKIVYIDKNEIWLILRKIFGITSPEIQELTKEWLIKVYKLRRVTTTIKLPENFGWLVG